jgi:Transglutaminase-like superfamily
VLGNCRHFTVLTVAALRAHGIPARARCGFGGYLGTGWYEDHWACEYWNAAAGHWTLADAQIDDVQRKAFDAGLDVLDVPRDAFLVIFRRKDVEQQAMTRGDLQPRDGAGCLPGDPLSWVPDRGRTGNSRTAR